jgi:glyoxylase-like metal-dependent hydrolase (beta-lactamase superfamily II)
VRIIDLHQLGHERVIGCWQVGEVLVDPGPASCMPRLLEQLGDEVPRALLLTHIHLDHAGASGSLVKHWPHLEVYVHERGARHLASPERLLASATQLYGADMDRLWGEFLAVPEDRIRPLIGGETVLGEFEVAYTPGHASHHVSYLHEGTAFVGDVGGVQIMPGGPVIAPTPPPDIDIELWQDSIALLRGWRPERLAFTHFGSTEEPERHLNELSERMQRWADAARDAESDAFVAYARAEIERCSPGDSGDEYFMAAAPDQLYLGLRRYWDKRAAKAAETRVS